MRKKRSLIWKIDSNLLKESVAGNNSFASILHGFNLASKGGNVKTLKARLKLENIDFSHIKEGRDSNRDKKLFYKTKIPLLSMLIENSPHSRNNLKKRLIAEGLLTNHCCLCNLKDIWNNKPIVLVLDHINGINNDYRLENLRLLCPNCNSQTETFSGKNVKRVSKFCLDCNSKIKPKTIRCFSCSKKAPNLKNRKVERPLREDLERLVWEVPCLELKNQLGVCDRMIGKWCQDYGIEKPGRGYWAKKKKLDSEIY